MLLACGRSLFAVGAVAQSFLGERWLGGSKPLHKGSLGCLGALDLWTGLRPLACLPFSSLQVTSQPAGLAPSPSTSGPSGLPPGPGLQFPRLPPSPIPSPSLPFQALPSPQPSPPHPTPTHTHTSYPIQAALVTPFPSISLLQGRVPRAPCPITARPRAHAFSHIRSQKVPQNCLFRTHPHPPCGCRLPHVCAPHPPSR